MHLVSVFKGFNINTLLILWYFKRTYMNTFHENICVAISTYFLLSTVM